MQRCIGTGTYARTDARTDAHARPTMHKRAHARCGCTRMFGTQLHTLACSLGRTNEHTHTCTHAHRTHACTDEGPPAYGCGQTDGSTQACTLARSLGWTFARMQTPSPACKDKHAPCMHELAQAPTHGWTHVRTHEAGTDRTHARGYSRTHARTHELAHGRRHARAHGHTCELRRARACARKLGSTRAHGHAHCRGRCGRKTRARSRVAAPAPLQPGRASIFPRRRHAVSISRPASYQRGVRCAALEGRESGRAITRRERGRVCMVSAGTARRVSFRSVGSADPSAGTWHPEAMPCAPSSRFRRQLD